MQKERIIALIRQPEAFTQEDLLQLKEVLTEWPYFHAGHQLLLLQLQRNNSELFDQELLSSALLVADRAILFNLLHAVPRQEIKDSGKSAVKAIKNEPLAQEKPEVEIKTNTVTAELHDFVLEENVPVEMAKDIPIELNQSMGTGREDLLDLETETESTLEEASFSKDTSKEVVHPPLEKDKLIDQFLENIPVFKPARIVEDEPITDIAADSVKKDEEVVTETLAAIYMNQELFDAAISVYEKLILKYPEKSTYFASRIEEIRKLIK